MSKSAIFGLGSRAVGLELYTPLDETSGPITDLSGNAYPGTIVGSTQNFNALDRGKAISHDGIDDHVFFDAAALLADFAGGTVRSMSFWAASDAYRLDQAAFSIGKDNTNDVVAIYPYYDGGMGATEIRVWFNGTFIITVSTAILANEAFNHYGLVSRSATDHELYANGVSIGTSSASNTMVGDITDVVYGGYDVTGNEPFQGQTTIHKLSTRDWTDAEMFEDFRKAA